MTGDSISVNGTTYNSANPTGTEVFSGVGPNGCDSTVTISLSFLAPLASSINQTLCDGESISVNGTTYNSANPTGSEVFSGVGPNSCDSTVTISLSFLAPLASSINQTLCNGESISVNGTTYDASNPTGSEVFSGVGPSSCDSTVNISLSFLAPLASSINQTLCNGDSISVNGTTYNAANPSGSEVFSGIGPNSCDSTVTISLSFLAPLASSINQTLCDGESISVNGTTYDAANPTGSEVFSGIGPNSCDSTVTISLSFLAPLASSINQTLCEGESISVNGTTYDAANPTGSEVFSGVGSSSCDSTVTISLSFLAPLASSINQTLCDGESISVNGTTYDAANPNGTEVFSGVGPSSCDSTVTISLSFLAPLTSAINQTLCGGESLIVNGTVYNAANPTGTEIFTGIGPNSCDSTVTINLSFHSLLSSSINQTLCAGESLTVNGTVYDASNPNGVEVYTNIGANNCDSTVTISLNFDTIDVSVNENGAMLSAVSSTGSYSWLDCNNGFAAITGEENADFTASENGSYAVMISENNCIDTSTCYDVIGLGLNQNMLNANYIVYPNPSRGQFVVSSENGNKLGQVTIYDLLGKAIFQQEFFTSEAQIILDEGQANGVYLLAIQQNGQIIKKKFTLNR